MTRKLSILMIGLLAFLLVACGGGGGSGGSLSLDQTFNQNGLSFKYPAGWVSDGESGQAYVASNQSLLDNAQSTDVPTLKAGERIVAMLVFDAQTVSAIGSTSPLD